MTDRLRPRNYVEAAAIISGASALLIAGFLERYRREWREYAAPLSKDMGLQVADTVESIKLAADTYRSAVSDLASERGNASGNRRKCHHTQSTWMNGSLHRTPLNSWASLHGVSASFFSLGNWLAVVQTEGGKSPGSRS